MKTQTKNVMIILAVSVIMLATSCKQESKAKNAAQVTEEEVESVAKTSEITLLKLEGSPAYETAALVLNTPKSTTSLPKGEIDFSFDVKNYELGVQTQSVNAEALANSGKGQHIHFILDNQPYSAHYSPTFKKEIPEGVHHLVAFLSRSYHESVKNENSVVVKKIEVGGNPKDSLGVSMDAPTLIYSRPKGKYTGEDSKKIMLDFFVLNTKLDKEGSKVQAIINGKEFIITEWAPYVIEGLPMGEVSIALNLLDANGNVISGPFNQVNRTITLEP